MTVVHIGPDYLAGDPRFRVPLYTNGSVLSAKDLLNEREATETALQMLGSAIGYGVVTGLAVSAASDSELLVSKGWGLNRNGTLIDLYDDSPLPLSAPQAGSGQFTAATFTPTQKMAEGAYLLTVQPANHDAYGPSPADNWSDVGITLHSRKWRRKGVAFQVHRLDTFAPPNGDTTAPERLRNALAYWCFANGGLDIANVPDLNNDELPLAVYYWTGAALLFVDTWAARRGIVSPSDATGSAWAELTAKTHPENGTARFSQFQEQLDAMIANPAIHPQTVTAADHFHFLPPVGILTVTHPSSPSAPAPALPAPATPSAATHNGYEAQLQQLFAEIESLRAEVTRLEQDKGIATATQVVAPVAQRSTASVFDLATFFGPNTPKTINVVEREVLDDMLRRSFYAAPLDVSQPLDIALYVARDTWAQTGSAPIQVMFARKQPAATTVDLG